MLTFRNNFWKPTRPRGNKRIPSTYVNHKKQHLPLVPFKPSFINISHFCEHRNCSRLIEENSWLTNVKLYNNPELKELIYRDFETLTIQLSKDFLEQSIARQRDDFIRAVCYFIAQWQFPERDLEDTHLLLVKRYIPTNQNKLKEESLKKNNKI